MSFLEKLFHKGGKTGKEKTPSEALVATNQNNLSELPQSPTSINVHNISTGGSGDNIDIEKAVAAAVIDRKSTCLNSSHILLSRMPFSA